MVQLFFTEFSTLFLRTLNHHYLSLVTIQFVSDLGPFSKYTIHKPYYYFINLKVSNQRNLF